MWPRNDRHGIHGIGLFEEGFWSVRGALVSLGNLAGMEIGWEAGPWLQKEGMGGGDVLRV